MSSPNHSPNSSMILPAPALAESLTTDPSSSAQMADLIQQAVALGSSSAQSSLPSVEDDNSQPNSPVATTPPTLATPPHLQAETSQNQQTPKYRILTIHLEKDNEGQEWAIPISGGWKSDMDIDVTSAYHLGGWFESRMGNMEKALQYFLSAAERGHTRSMIKAAALYEADNNVVGVSKPLPERDPKKAFEWYKRAADASEQSGGTSRSSGPDPLACYIVGTTYGTGSQEADVDKNYELALLYYNRCMAITAPRIDADFSVVNHDIIPKSYLRSHAPHTADERHFCSAAFQTGLIYLYGSSPEGEVVRSVTDVQVDPQLAIRYWKEAALLGHAQACYNIGIMYANGMGVEKDLFVAGKWFGRAIKLDNTGKLIVPDGVKIVDWDTTKEALALEQKEKVKMMARQRKERHRKKRRSKRKSQEDTLLPVFFVLGSVAMVGAAFWWYYRGNRHNH
ncbi:hypothetical protein EC973_004873 [Apophysomyces ossiformis]|uniref:HCP-like protein n=1 Tax=Apophysomyces ossiformis TaxID=679940 RepID=A0A8H7ET09_9FUNG|nr:hypothetical protein EC973_004873 [Apophysomyces ossiformis]